MSTLVLATARRGDYLVNINDVQRQIIPFLGYTEGCCTCVAFDKFKRFFGGVAWSTSILPPLKSLIQVKVLSIGDQHLACSREGHDRIVRFDTPRLIVPLMHFFPIACSDRSISQ